MGENDASKKFIEKMNDIFCKELSSALKTSTQINACDPDDDSSCEHYGGFVAFSPPKSFQLAAQDGKVSVVQFPCLFLNIQAKTATSEKTTTSACAGLVAKAQVSPHTLFCNVGMFVDLETESYSIWLISPFIKNDPRCVCESSPPDYEFSMIEVATNVSLNDPNHVELKQCAHFMTKVVEHTSCANVRTITRLRCREGSILNEVTAVDFTSLRFDGSALDKLVDGFTVENVKEKVRNMLSSCLENLSTTQFIYKHTLVRDVNRYNDIVHLFTQHNAAPPNQHVEKMILLGPLCITQTQGTKMSYNSCVTLMCEKIDFAFFQHMSRPYLKSALTLCSDPVLTLFGKPPTDVRDYIQHLLQEEDHPPIEAYIDLMFAMISAYFDKGYVHRDVRWPNLSFWTPPAGDTPVLSVSNAEYALDCVDDAAIDKNLRTYESVLSFLEHVDNAIIKLNDEKSTKKDELYNKIEELYQKQCELYKKQGELFKKQGELYKKQGELHDGLISKLDELNQETDELIKKTDKSIQRFSAQIENLESQIAQKTTQLDNFEYTIPVSGVVGAEVVSNSLDNQVIELISAAISQRDMSSLPITPGESIIANMNADIAFLYLQFYDTGTAPLLIPATVIDCICLLLCRFPLLLRADASCDALLLAFCPIIAFIKRVLEKLKATSTTSDQKEPLITASKSLLVALLTGFQSQYDLKQPYLSEHAQCAKNETSFMRGSK